MHKRIKINKIFVIFITIVFILSISTIANADLAEDIVDRSSVDPSGGIDGARDLFTLGNKILSILQFIGGGVAVIATLLLAIRYMYSSPPDDKAEIKRKLIPYIIGGVMIFGVTNLIQLAAQFVSDLGIE